MTTLQRSYSFWSCTNYHVWANNIQTTLQAKGLYVNLALPNHPPGSLIWWLHLPRGNEFPETPYKEGDKLMKAMQSNEFLTWEHAHEKYEHWLSKDNSTVGLIHSTIKYTQHETIAGIKGSRNIWEHLWWNYIDQQGGINVYYYYQQMYAKWWDGNSPLTDHLGFYMNVHCQFIKAGHTIDNYTILNVILLSLPCAPTWEVIKQNLLFCSMLLILETVTTKFLSVYKGTAMLTKLKINIINDQSVDSITTSMAVSFCGHTGSISNHNFHC